MATQTADLGAIMAVEGMLGADEAALLFRLAAEARQPIVEIGSYRGRSTVALALGALAGAGVPVYAIDPHAEFTEPGGFHFGRADATAHLQALIDAGVSEIVRVVQLPASAVEFGEAIGLLWIDGDHDAALADFQRFGWRVPFRGRVAFHDRHLPGVQAAIVHAEWDGFREIETCGPLIVLERRDYA